MAKRETFDEARERHERQEATGRACAAARFARGERLTDDERSALEASSRWGSDSYPVRKLGRGWTFRRGTVRAPTIYPTKAAAVAAYETLLAIYRGVLALEAHARAVAASGVREA